MPQSGTVAAQQSAVNQSVTNVSKLPDVIKAVSPFASANTGTVSTDGTIAYANVSWSVNPSSLDASYLDKLNSAAAPATKAGLQVAYGAGAGQIGQQTQDLTSEVIGLSLRAGAAADHVRLADRGWTPAARRDLQRPRPAWRCSP